MKLRPLYHNGCFPEDLVIDREEICRMYDNISYYDKLESIYNASVDQLENKWSQVCESLKTGCEGLSGFEAKALEARYERAKAQYVAALDRESRKFDIAVLRFEQLIAFHA